jgi:hypothetical protein
MCKVGDLLTAFGDAIDREKGVVPDVPHAVLEEDDGVPETSAVRAI